MSLGSPGAGDVPSLYDVVINGKGYCLLRTIDTSLPFRTQRAKYTRTATFIQRSNTTDAYGDDQQDFFLTDAQRDWSGGGEVRHRVKGDVDSERSFFYSIGVNVHYPGELTIAAAYKLVSSTTNTTCMTPLGQTLGLGLHGYVTQGGSGHLRRVNSSGTDVDLGAHGAGTACQWGATTDGVNVFIAGATTIRRYNGAFNNFGAANANAGSLAFLNNTLYSCDASTLKSYDGAGVPTTLFTWKDGTNTAMPPLNQAAKLVPYGGNLLIYFPYLNNCPELWQWDGTACKRIHAFPESMIGYDCFVLEGIVYCSGIINEAIAQSGGVGSVPVIFFYNNGTVGELWKGLNAIANPVLNCTQSPALGSSQGRLVFTNMAGPYSASYLQQYDLATGAISALASFVDSVSIPSTPYCISSSTSVLVGAQDAAGTIRQYPDASGLASSGELRTCLFDFGNALTKTFRGVTVDWEGAGGVVTVGYQVDSQELGVYTGLGNPASGVESLIAAGVQGRSISIRLLITPSGSNYPKIKRLFVRASPILQSYRECEYILDCSGKNGKSHVMLNDDDTAHPKDGLEQVTNLNTAIAATTPFAIIDRFGTYTGIIEPDLTEIIEVSPEEYIARVATREV